MNLPRMGRGFTLIELLVVLLILTAVTTVALRSTSKLEDRSRFDRTQQILKQIERATVGSLEEQFHGSAMSCYLSDTGEMPRALNDLLVRPKAIVASHVDAASNLASGWNGPYLDLPFGATDLVDAPILDGFGAAIQLTIGPSNDASLADLDLWSIATTTPDGFVLDRTLLSDTIDRVHCIVPVSIQIADDAAATLESFTVVAFTPRDGTIETIERDERSGGSGPASVVFAAIDGVSPGQRAFRARATTKTASYESALEYVKLVPGANPTLVLTCHPVSNSLPLDPSVESGSAERSVHASGGD